MQLGPAAPVARPIVRLAQHGRYSSAMVTSAPETDETLTEAIVT